MAAVEPAQEGARLDRCHERLAELGPGCRLHPHIAGAAVLVHCIDHGSGAPFALHQEIVRRHGIGDDARFRLHARCGAVGRSDEIRPTAPPGACSDLAMGLKAAIMLLNPARIVIGGGISKAGDALFVPLREELRRQITTWSRARIDVVPAELGDDSVLYGAMALAEMWGGPPGRAHV